MKNQEQEQKPKNSDDQLLISAVMRSTFFKEEMKKAFMHGREFEHLDTNGCELDVTNVDDKHLPFNDWFAKYYSNFAVPYLAADAIKEAVEILSAEKNASLHFSKYPQDRWKDESEPPEISKLISTANFHMKRWQRIKSVIDYLVEVSSICR